jgi:hypothetical protein
MTSRDRESSELLRVVPGPSGDAGLRSFLFAQIQWEHYHASRIRLVHALAGGGLVLWLLLGFAPGPADPLHRGAVVAWAICFLATGFAAVMEHRWSRRRRRLAALMGASHSPDDATAIGLRDSSIAWRGTAPRRSRLPRRVT